jgi:hypothetical protein
MGIQAVEQRAGQIEVLVERSQKQLFFAVEVVVERAHADICGLSYFQHRHVEPADGGEALRGFDQCRPRAVLAPFQPIGQPVRLVCHCAPIDFALFGFHCVGRLAAHPWTLRVMNCVGDLEPFAQSGDPLRGPPVRPSHYVHERRHEQHAYQCRVGQHRQRQSHPEHPHERHLRRDQGGE